MKNPRMKDKLPSPIHKRIILTSVVIIFAFSIVLGLVLSQLYKKSQITLHSIDLLSAVPELVRELRHDKAHELNLPLYNTNKPLSPSKQTDYLGFICHKNKTLFWMSEHSRKKGLENICQSLPSSLPEPELFFIHNLPYLVHEITYGARSFDGTFFVIREASLQLENLATIKRKTWLSLGLLFFIATTMIYSASYWSFRPLRKLADELNDIAQSQQEQLKEKYPPELEEVTEALNRMIAQRKEQTQRYRHAMDDLAHSLKSRLAATNAILDDNTLNREGMTQRIMEQVSQMDEMVQYQLKRALLGQRGLVRECTPLQSEIDNLTRLFTKIYADKPVTLKLYLKDTPNLPINKADLTELLGNLLENAFRFCLETIQIKTQENTEAFYLIIEDDGPGVPFPFQESIFQRGVRADQRNPGTGIGLSVCDDIIKSYGGSIKVRTSGLEGAAFILRFPK